MKDATNGVPIPAGTTVVVRAKTPFWAAINSGIHTAYPTLAALLLLAYYMAGQMHVDGSVLSTDPTPAMNSSPILWLVWWGFVHPSSPKEPSGFWWPFVWTQVLIPAWRGLSTGQAARKQVAAPVPNGVNL